MFFSVPADPSAWVAGAVFLALALASFAARARPRLFMAGAVATIVAGGFFSAALRVEQVRGHILERSVRGEAIGIVERVEPRGRGRTRLLIRIETLANVPAGQLPTYVRVSATGARQVQAGARVSVEALWRPPPGAVRPGGYDFARQAFFQQLGAVGSEGRAVRILEPPTLTLGGRFSAATDRLRNAITARVLAVVPGDAGAIAAALVTGQRGDISTSANDALRTAGLYHVISISGLHMALFGGTLFTALRVMLVLIPGFGLRFPAKKIGAFVALLGACGYLYLSGVEVAAQRSFIMIAVVFVAVIFDRQGVTMRNLSLAALCTIVLTPESVIGPSFQMSFAAVMALVAWYERARLQHLEEEAHVRRTGLSGRVIAYFGGIVATTVLATLATAPFATFHFQRIALHSLPSNLLALPLVSTLIMPFALIGFLLMPFGLDAPAWIVMGYGIELMLQTAYWIASWPGANTGMAAFSPVGVLLLALGLCWTAIWTTRLRLLGIAPIIAGLLFAAFPGRPDIYIEAGGRAAAVRAPDGRLQVSGVRFAGFAAQNWLAADGDTRSPRDPSVAAEVHCDSFGCTLPMEKGGFLALNWTYAALREDCQRAAIVVTRLIAPPDCRTKSLVIDGTDLAEGGAMALTHRPDGTFAISRADTARRIWDPITHPPAGPSFAAIASDGNEADSVPEDDNDETDPEALVTGDF
ncbi:ComEC/Rec2 family competence protein [Terrihabitans sp. B22-R8]|uniref:ComEC/Rec2 family competence protein n=1 Tax=Terrihabitans sp. B22-R8 TaxID=3425128 RepID=UPI00403C6C6E